MLDPILWTKCGSDAEFTSPEIGSALTKVGTPIYEPGIFGNAVKCDANTERWLFNPNDYFTDMHYGTIEFWFKNDSNVAADSNYVQIFRNVNNYPLIGAYNTGGGKATLRIVIAKRPATTYLLLDKAVNTLFEGWHHIGISWDADGIAGSKQWIFIDGNLEASANITMSGMLIPNGNWGAIGDNPEFPGANYLKELVDNVKMYNYAKTDFSDRIVEGLTDVATSQIGRSKPRVYILGNVDIYALGHVKDIITIKEQKTFKRDKIINAQYTMNVNNFSNIYSVDNARSIFKNINWNYTDFKIYNEYNDLIWNGILRDIERNHENGTANLVTINKLYEMFNRKVQYTSSTWETPADVFKNICDTYSIDYDFRSVQLSINQYTAESCYIKCNISLEDNTTVMEILEKLGEIGCADVYSHLNMVYCKHWQAFTGNIKVNLTESDIESFTSVKRLESEIINQYRIGYENDQGSPATDTLLGASSRAIYGQHDLPEMNTSSIEEQICFKDSTSATYIGECYIRRTHVDIEGTPKPVQEIQISIKGNNVDWIDLETYFSLTWEDEDWSAKSFEIMAWEYNFSSNIINISAYEV